MEQLYNAGRLQQKRHKTNGETQAQQLLANGWSERCVWKDESYCECQVPSASTDGLRFTVDLVRGLCDCIAASQGGELL